MSKQTRVDLYGILITGVILALVSLAIVILVT